MNPLKIDRNAVSKTGERLDGSYENKFIARNTEKVWALFLYNT